MDARFSRLPRALQAQAKHERLGPTGVPALIAHPDWSTPSPVVVWMHGRTASKELDAGRYLRWIRAGVGVCAIDLPGHGERIPDDTSAAHDPRHSLGTIARVLPELDAVVSELTSDRFEGAFDPQKLGLGGMSLGGMAALRRLADPHPFAAAAVEATCGSLQDLYFPAPDQPGAPWTHDHAPEAVRELDPGQHLDAWRPIPLLVLHSEADEMVPWPAQKRFLELLRNVPGAAPLLEVKTWPQTGAPREHLGFGSVSNEAKNLQTEFFARTLRATPS